MTIYISGKLNNLSVSNCHTLRFGAISAGGFRVEECMTELHCKRYTGWNV